METDSMTFRTPKQRPARGCAQLIERARQLNGALEVEQAGGPRHLSLIRALEAAAWFVGGKPEQGMQTRAWRWLPSVGPSMLAARCPFHVLAAHRRPISAK
jgi:hypothetical protein